MVRPAKERALYRNDRIFLRLALIGALAASLGLAACGRKGPLDPPPAASLAGEQANAPGAAGSNRQAQPQQEGAGITSAGEAVAPKGPHKQIPLDVLLN